MAQQWRVQFDAEVSFVNGGGLRADGFRLDIPGTEITDGELAALLDDTSPAGGGARPAHSTLLAAGIPIVEHPRGLDSLPRRGSGSPPYRHWSRG